MDNYQKQILTIRGGLQPSLAHTLRWEVSRQTPTGLRHGGLPRLATLRAGLSFRSAATGGLQLSSEVGFHSLAVPQLRVEILGITAVAVQHTAIRSQQLSVGPSLHTLGISHVLCPIHSLAVGI